MVNLTNGANKQPDDNYSGYFKYFSDTKEVIDSLFKHKKIRFSQPWALNDPLEFNPRLTFNTNKDQYKYFNVNGTLLPSLEMFFRINLIERQINNYGMLSLTKVPDSFDMWTHYASGHKGFLIEFKNGFENKQCMKSKDNVEYPVEKVNYADDYLINIDEFINDSNINPDEEIKRKLFYEKTSRWAHEIEYRMVRPLTDCNYYDPPKKRSPYRDSSVYLFEFTLDCIQSIAFGSRMSIENKKLIRLCCKNENIDFLQVIIVKDEKDLKGKSGRIMLSPLSDFKPDDQIYKMEPSGFTGDMNLFRNHGTIDINNLDELPYYEGHEEYCQELFLRYKNKKT